MGQMAVCCQNLILGVLSSRSVLSMLVGPLFIKFGLFFNRVVLSDNQYLKFKTETKEVTK
jgi:hypothetical protein